MPLLALLLVASAAETSTASAEPPFSPAQLEYLRKLREDIRRETQGRATEPAPAPPVIELKAEAYMKWLFRNNTRQGCVTYGNPHPRGDNYSGDNGACPELALTLTGRPTPKIEGGFRLQSRYGQDFADWFENGDRRELPDASGESLGLNHAAPIQLRGIYVRLAEPLPLVDWFLVGSSDLSFWDPWTVGRVRFIDRHNAKGIFLKTSLFDALDLLVARVAMAKLFGTANYNSLEEELVTNPFWARDAVYAWSLGTKPALMPGLSVTVNGGLSLDEESDLRDPDAPGSQNALDARDDVASAAARFVGLNTALLLDLTYFDGLRARATLALSHNAPDLAYVTNLALGGLGFSNVVYQESTDVAGVLRVELTDLLGRDSALRFEYFNIGAEFNAVAGARREADVLLTDGLVEGGQLPTLNLANELIDFTDPFYESVVGWHGATLVFDRQGELLDLAVEATFIEYNTDLQGRNMDVYPGFGGFTGYTDTDLFSYANTNDRGRDPRAVYARNQARRTLLFMGKVGLKPDWWAGSLLELKAKLIQDSDLRDEDTELDDYAGTILTAWAKVSAQPLDRLTLSLALKGDWWQEDGRSGSYAGGAPRFLDYQTLKLRPQLELRYTLGGFAASYHLEAVKKKVSTSDETQDYASGLIWRSLGYVSAQF